MPTLDFSMLPCRFLVTCQDKTRLKSLSICSFLQASAATIHGAPAGPGSTAVAAARYKDKCVLEIVSIFCIENPLFDPFNPIRLAIPSPHWPTATVKPTRKWSTMCYSVRLGESIDLLKQLPKTNIWAMTTKRLIDCKSSIYIICLSIMISCDLKWYWKCFRPPWRGRLASWR